MKKRIHLKLIFLLLPMFILIFVLFFYKSPKYNGHYSNYDLISSKQTIKKSFEYRDMKNEEKLYSLYSDNLSDAIKRELNNIKTIHLNDISFAQDEHLYSGDFGAILGTKDTISRKDIIVYNVDYYIEYFDDSIEPIENGDQKIFYYLVKNNGKWIIVSIGY